jgi:hypothetical protein
MCMCNHVALFNKGLFHGCFKQACTFQQRQNVIYGWGLWMAAVSSVLSVCCKLRQAFMLLLYSRQPRLTTTCVPRSKCVVLQRQVFVRCEVW